MTLAQLTKAYGSDSDIARAIGCSRQLVAYWRAHGGVIAPARQAWIEVKTGGKFKADVVDRQKRKVA
jgi:hypothetical protein